MAITATLIIASRTPVELLGTAATADDYIGVAREAYAQEDYARAVLWFQAAQQQPHDTQAALIEDYLAFSFFKLNDLAAAVQHTSTALAITPHRARLVHNLAAYTAMLGEQQTSGRNASDVPVVEATAARDNILRHTEDEMAAFRALCRGEKLRNAPLVPPKCHYKSNHPALLLRPQAVCTRTICRALT